MRPFFRIVSGPTLADLCKLRGWCRSDLTRSPRLKRGRQGYEFIIARIEQKFSRLIVRMQKNNLATLAPVEPAQSQFLTFAEESLFILWNQYFYMWISFLARALFSPVIFFYRFLQLRGGNCRSNWTPISANVIALIVRRDKFNTRNTINP